MIVASRSRTTESKDYQDGAAPRRTTEGRTAGNRADEMSIVKVKLLSRSSLRSSFREQSDTELLRYSP